MATAAGVSMLKLARRLHHQTKQHAYDPQEHINDPNVNFFYKNMLIFVENGATNPDAQNEFGRTLLMYALIHKNIILIRYLLRMGASPDVKDNNGNDSYHYTWNAKIRQKIIRNQKMILWNDYEDNIDYIGYLQTRINYTSEW